MDRAEHWDSVYRQKAAHEVSWFQAEAALSIELIEHCQVPKSARILDVGAGASTLADGLLARGYGDVTLLDIAPSALAATRQRLGEATALHYEIGDVTTWRAQHSYDVWHDRAVFHFLTEATEREAYRCTLAAALPRGAYAIIATFADDGPERCSGLPVQRYAPEALANEFSRELRALETRRHHHVTPGGSKQSFVFARFERK